MSIKMIFASAAALAMVAATPAVAAKSQSQNQQSAAIESGSGGEKAKKICRSFSKTVTRVKREKLCLTRADWKRFERGEI